MKLQILFLSIFLITLVESEYIYNATTMDLGTEETVYGLKSNKKYYYTVSAGYNYKYTFKIKVKNNYISSSSYLSVSYIVHSSSYPNAINSYNTDYDYLFCSNTGTSFSYYSFEYSYSNYKYSSAYYITFVLTPSKNIDSASITIKRTSIKNISDDEASFLKVIFSIFIICVAFCIIFAIVRSFYVCLKIKPIIQPSPQPNYAPLIPQYQQPQPTQPAQPQPQYMAPPQKINPQQNVNGYSPGQLYASS